MGKKVNTPQTSTTLLAKLNRGDAEAFARLFTEYGEFFAEVLKKYRICGVDVEDLVSEAILRVWDKRERFTHDGSGSFRKWLATVGRNIARNLADRAQLESRATKKLLPDEVGPDVTTEEAEFRKTVESQINQYMMKHHPHDWQAYRRYKLDGGELDEVAAELDMTGGAVMASASRVKTKHLPDAIVHFGLRD